jgi:hypothetical protein
MGHTQWKNNKRTFHYNAKQPVEMDNEKGRYFPNQENRKKTYTLYNPQPENVIILRRYYSTLKRDKSYKKCVSWFDDMQQIYHKSIWAVSKKMLQHVKKMSKLNLLLKTFC